MRIAIDLSELSTCDRKRVGAVMVRDGRCISWGFNGAAPGMPHCEENNHGWGNVDESAGVGLDTYGCRNAMHAEANALAFAAREGISTDDCDLYVTVSPCKVCAHLLIAAGVHAVFYHEEYRDHSGMVLLDKADVGCYPLPV